MKQIIFMNKEELKEAIDFNMFSSLSEANCKAYEMLQMFPAVVSSTGASFYRIPPIDKNVIRDIMKAKLWEDIRDEYRPKEWYELQENKGKWVLVRDDEIERWKPAIFKRYSDNPPRYTTEHGYSYRYARLITEEEVAKDVK